MTGAIGGIFGGLGGVAGGAIGGSTGALAGAVAGGATGGAVSAAVTGGDVGMGALTGAIAGGIGWGVGWVNENYLDKALSNFTVATFSGSLGGGIGAVLQGGNFWQGAAYGAVGAAMGHGVYAAIRAPWTKLSETIRQKGDADIDSAEGDGLDLGVNDWKYGHASHTSAAQRVLGVLASPFITAYGVVYEGWHIFFPGHTKDYGTIYEDLTVDRSAFRFRGFFDGQHPVNWLWDTPGDMMANVFGQFSGLFLSPPAAAQFNRATFLIPGPNYPGENAALWEKLAPPGAKWPW